MRYIPIFLICFFFVSCMDKNDTGGIRKAKDSSNYVNRTQLFDSLFGKQNKSTSYNSAKTTDLDENPVKEDPSHKLDISRTEKELEFYLDSIAALPIQPLMEKASYFSDSVFSSFTRINKTLSESDFSALKKAIEKGDINYSKAVDLFGQINLGSRYIKNNRVPITFYSFDDGENDFNEFAVIPGYPDVAGECDLFFFKHNVILNKHAINHGDELILEHYKDADGNKVVYYVYEFIDGSGLWWFNFFFHKYYGSDLIPVLNHLQSGNVQSFWGSRTRSLDSEIESTNPLAMKMVFEQSFVGSFERPCFVCDSTVITFDWNEASKSFVGNYEDSKLSQAQILTYNLDDNDLLFLNAYHSLLKLKLKDTISRNGILQYLNDVKSEHDNL